MGENYNKNFPPLPNFLTFGHDHYLSLNTSIYILDIIGISLDPGVINIFIKIKLRWFDDNLKFSGLKDDHHRNAINETVEKTIWIPKLGFKYLKKKVEITYRSLTMEKKDGPIISMDIDKLYRKRFYEGSKNSIKLTIFQKMEFLCHFKTLSYEYPFGQDQCSLDIYYKNHDNLLATFNIKKLGEIECEIQMLPFKLEHCSKKVYFYSYLK